MRKGQAHVSRGKVAEPVDLRITAEHINKGCRDNAAICVVAQAVLSFCPSATHIHCDIKEVSWSDPTTQMRTRMFNTPRGAALIRAFDKGEMEKIKPTRLRLNEGITFPMGWRAKHPGSTRKGKTYKRTGKAGIRYTKYRHFGACNIQDYEAPQA